MFLGEERRMKDDRFAHKTETYMVRSSIGGRKSGSYIATQCGNLIYTINDPMDFNGVLCPKCFYKGKHVTLVYKGDIE